MCLDDFPLTGEGEVSIVILALVQLAQVGAKAGSRKIHPLEVQFTILVIRKELKETGPRIR